MTEDGKRVDFASELDALLKEYESKTCTITNDFVCQYDITKEYRHYKDLDGCLALCNHLEIIRNDYLSRILELFTNDMIKHGDSPTNNKINFQDISSIPPRIHLDMILLLQCDSKIRIKALWMKDQLRALK